MTESDSDKLPDQTPDTPGADDAPPEQEEATDQQEAAPEDDDDTPPEDDGRPLVALGAWAFFIKRFIIFGILMAGYGGQFFIDGFISWPQQNEAADALEAQGKTPEFKKHSAFDILANRAIGVSVPPLGLLLLLLTIYDSRGALQMADDVLRVPGHPPIPVSAITGLDKRKWDRKGIAFVEYTLESADGAVRQGRIKIDDYAYQQGPTDRIVDRIDAYLNAHAEQPGDEAPAEEA